MNYQLSDSELRLILNAYDKNHMQLSPFVRIMVSNLITKVSLTKNLSSEEEMNLIITLLVSSQKRCTKLDDNEIENKQEIVSMPNPTKNSDHELGKLIEKLILFVHKKSPSKSVEKTQQLTRRK